MLPISSALQHVDCLRVSRTKTCLAPASGLIRGRARSLARSHSHLASVDLELDPAAG